MLFITKIAVNTVNYTTMTFDPNESDGNELSSVCVYTVLSPHSTQHTAHSTQHTAHNTQHTTHSTQHTAHNIQ